MLPDAFPICFASHETAHEVCRNTHRKEVYLWGPVTQQPKKAITR